jgi:hypothetical protein
MTSFTIRLPEHQARLVALAVSYHLARPGSEIDRSTMSEYQHGLSELQPVIEAQINESTATFDLTPLQGVLLSTAFSSVVSELKMYSVFDTMSGSSNRPRSTAPGFDDRLRTLFPEVAGDPTYAMALAEDMAMLRRDMPFARAREALGEERLTVEDTQKRRKKPWQFWKHEEAEKSP